jgi:hypothetical protein
MKRQFYRTRGSFGGWTGIFFLCAVLGVLSQPLRAAQRFAFESTIRLDEQTLERRGTGHFTYWFWSLYDGALYLPAEEAPEAVLEVVPKRLDLAYFREIPAEKMVEAGQKILRKNVTEAEWNLIADRLTRINAAYQTVDEGDRYQLTFVPGRGTTLSLNGEELITIPGDDFARLYFRIWFGEDPVGADFRDDLMGR